METAYHGVPHNVGRALFGACAKTAVILVLC